MNELEAVYRHRVFSKARAWSFSAAEVGNGGGMLAPDRRKLAR
jgi:hypothetical protein